MADVVDQHGLRKPGLTGPAAPRCDAADGRVDEQEEVMIEDPRFSAQIRGRDRADSARR